jgi:hypothetical protein
MLTENINVDKGIVNRVLNVVVNIGFDIHHKVDVIIVILDHHRLQLKVKRCTVKFNYTSKGRFYKSTIPLTLVYAKIGHKSQEPLFHPKY